MANSNFVRCPQCSRKIGSLQPDGTVEIQHRRQQRACVKVGSVSCPQCGSTVVVGESKTTLTHATWGDSKKSLT